MTLLLWLVNFTNLIDLYSLSSWLPSVIQSAGLSESSAILAGAALQMGGVVGTLLLGRIVDRYGFVPAMSDLFSPFGSDDRFNRSAFHRSGAIIFCNRSLRLLHHRWPTCVKRVRDQLLSDRAARNRGWLEFGYWAFGSVLGPLIGGLLITQKWSNNSLFIAATVPALVSAIVVFGIAAASKSNARRINAKVL